MNRPRKGDDIERRAAALYEMGDVQQPGDNGPSWSEPMPRQHHVNYHHVNHGSRGGTPFAIGLVAFVVAVMSLMVGWVPFLGLLAIPGAVIALLLAGLGLLISLFSGLKGFAMPFVAAVVSVLAIVLPLSSTAVTSVGITEASRQVSEEMDRQRQQSDQLSKQYIANSIEIYDVEASTIETLLDGTVTGIKLKLRNAGDRDLIGVDVTVYFNDSTGTTIYEKEFSPINQYSFGSGGSARTLNAGYIWQLDEDKYLTAESVPSEADLAMTTAEITDITFASSASP